MVGRTQERGRIAGEGKGVVSDLEGQQAIDALLDPYSWCGPYRPRCDECEYDGGAYLLGPVALKQALEHTKTTGHKVAVYRGGAAE